MDNELVPPEIKGKNTDLEHSVVLNTKEEAVETFKRAQKRLLNPPVWHELAGKASAEFVLTGDEGHEALRLAQKGDYLRIDIPGPGPSSGGGYDWVIVEHVEEISNPGKDEESFGIKLGASKNPASSGNDAAHFFREGATSSFIIFRKGNKVTASYHGRNELPNIATDRPMDNIRNAVVASGAFASLSELQWSALIKGLLEKEVGS